MRHAEHYIQGLNPSSGDLTSNLLAELRASRGLPDRGAMSDEALLERCRGAADEIFKVWKSRGIDPANREAVTAFYRDLDLYCYELIGFEVDAPESRQDQLKEFRDFLQQRQTRADRAFRGLDYGCGVGTTGLYLSAHGLACDYADVSRPNLAFVRERLSRRGLSEARVFDLNATRPPVEAYDYILAFDVLEHVANPAEVLKELIGYLRPGGFIIFNLVIHNEPGTPHLMNDAYLLRKVVRAYGTRLAAKIAEFKIYQKVLRPGWVNALIHRFDEIFWSYKAKRDAERGTLS